eukprot:10322060-Karenia_brevis.AAC.1
MVAEQDNPTGPPKQNQELWIQMKMLMDKMLSGDSKVNKEKQENSNRVILEEKQFRRMNKFTGDMSQFRMWMFKIGVAV